jgi:hypothetical protein
MLVKSSEMKFYCILLLTGLILFVNSSLFAQTNWKAGKILLNNEEVIEGYIDDNERFFGIKKIWFSTDKKGQGAQEIALEDINRISYHDGLTYDTKTLIINEKGVLFLPQLLIDGQFSIYIFNEGFFVFFDDQLRQLKFDKGKTYKLQLAHLFTACNQDILNKYDIDSNEKNARFLIRLVELYYACVGETNYKVYVELNQITTFSSHLEFSAGAGSAWASLRTFVELINPLFNLEIPNRHYYANVQANIAAQSQLVYRNVFNKNPKMSISTGLGYFYFGAKYKFDQSISPAIIEEISIQNHNLFLPIEFGYVLYDNQNSQVQVYAGPSLMMRLADNNTLSTFSQFNDSEPMSVSNLYNTSSLHPGLRLSMQYSREIGGRYFHAGWRYEFYRYNHERFNVWTLYKYQNYYLQSNVLLYLGVNIF